MTILIIVSWVFVVLLTAGNVFFFLKLKKASEQMMKMAVPGAKNMQEAMAGMQKMMQGMNRGGMRPGAGGVNPAQLRAAMDMLQKMQGR